MSTANWLLAKRTPFVKVFTAALTLCAASAIISCSQLVQDDKQLDNTPFSPPRALTASEQRVSNASANFGFNLFQQAARFEASKNMFVSPLSYAMALGMTANGTAGATRDSMLAALQYQSLNPSEANEAFKTLTDLLLGLDKNVEFRIANSIWYNQRYTVEQPFLALSKQYFDAEVRGMNFADPTSKDVVNAWVEQKTNNRIKNLIQTPFDPIEDLMVLVNAIYFNGAWTYRFEPQNTKDGIFTNDNGAKISCKMMSLDKEADLGYAAGQDYTVIDIPYSHRQYSMTVVLPNEGKKLSSVLGSLTPAAWNNITSRMSTTAAILVMPKFKMETRYEEQRNKQRELHALGMGIAFDPRRADFSAMYKPENVQFDPVCIGKVIHQTFLSVDERGTEAAAATAVQVIRVTSIGPTPPREIKLDRPFAFFIREKHSKAILFAGTLYEPKQ